MGLDLRRGHIIDEAAIELQSDVVMVTQPLNMPDILPLKWGAIATLVATIVFVLSAADAVPRLLIGSPIRKIRSRRE